ncbi:hypothetical protein H7F51_16550 [Novosphingobium flavum]|uniref:Uncharacterized protein n=1 Tax=Novosphingobium flavum TaxID=1778672 RepID=A0A7X1FUD4_9SPHN|nr:hypothetical protein [Novosphingobium flavum]MBC2667131.1 hypothetical protein [Novosphingobium flavum]
MRIGKTALLLAAAVICAPVAPAFAAPLACAISGGSAPGPIAAEAAANGVRLDWAGTGTDRVSLSLAIADGVPRIALLSVNGTPVLRDAGLRFEVTSGLRRISNQQLEPLRKLGVAITPAEVDEHKWDAFWDAPLDLAKPDQRNAQEMANIAPVEGIAGQPGLPRAPAEIERASARYAISACTVTLTPARAVVRLSGVTAGVFSGALELTAYAGTNLIRAALMAATDKASVAYKYDAGIEGVAVGPGVRVSWRDTTGAEQSSVLTGKPNAGPVPVVAANRLIMAETGSGGALAVFPAPHVYFWSREIETNVGNNWFAHDASGRLSLGIRQADKEVREEFRANWALYSAPPGSVQAMALYLYPAAGTAETARQGALAFTRGDHYAALPGYKVMAHHFHLGMGERLIASGSVDTRLRDFEALRGAGVDIVSVTDIFPDQRKPGGPRRLEVMQAYFEGAARSSDANFLVLPNVEAINILGGHWDVLLAHPTLWLEHRAADEPFMTKLPDGTPVYHLGGADDAIRMIRENGMLVYMPHPRTKGSTHYPDAIKASAAFNADFYRGIGWRWGMGSDLSEKRLSEKRVLPLYDEINNWMAARGQRPKSILAITETFDKEPGDDIYANNPVNYLKLDRLPQGQDYSAINAVLDRGDYFVTSGEVLIPEARLEGGERNDGGKAARLIAEVQWTFPLDMAEVIWGDGRRTGRKVIDTSDLPPLGSHRFEIPLEAAKARWLRFAAWDSAGNGAMTQVFAAAPGK